MVVNQTINVTEFKAKCLSLFDEVEAGKISITVTRRGKVIGVVSPPPKNKKKFKSAKGSWAGKLEIIGDIVNVDFSDMWDHMNGRSWDHNPVPSKSEEKPRLQTR